jgi:PEP-CTERM motif
MKLNIFTIHPIKLFTMALLVALCPLGAALAQTTFSVNGVAAAPAGGGGCASFSDISATAAFGSAAGGPCSNIVNIGSVEATASDAGLGTAATLTHFCCSTSSSSGAQSRVDTRLRISGPAGTVPVSLNLVLDSNSSPGAAISIGAQQFGSGSISVRQDGSFGQLNNGVLIPTPDCDGCLITTKTVNLNTNVDHFFRLQLNTQVISGTGDYTGAVDAFLGFPTDGFVFNLPEGYTASIEGMGVVDNRWISAVPEPGSQALLVLGLLGVAARLHRRRFG